MKRVVLFLAACSSSPAPARETTARPPPTAVAAAAPTAAPATESSPASPEREPEPDANAPVTPPKAYDAQQCKERVAKFEQRAMAAFEHADKIVSLAGRTLFADRVDADVAPPLVVWIARDGGPQGDWCGAWITEVVVGGKSVATHRGKQRNAKTLAAVKKRLPKRGTIGVHITPGLPMDTIAPFLVELQRLGPLALSVAVQGDEFAMPLGDAPAWALERYRAFKQSPSTRILSQGVRDAAINCPAHRVANDKVLADESGNKGWIVATQYPKAVAACACKNIDVDALELFTLVVLAGGYRSVGEGFLAMTIDPASATKLAAPTSQPFATELAKLTPEQRRAGIALEISGAPVTMARCK